MLRVPLCATLVALVAFTGCSAGRCHRDSTTCEPACETACEPVGHCALPDVCEVPCDDLCDPDVCEPPCDDPCEPPCDEHPCDPPVVEEKKEAPPAPPMVTEVPEEIVAEPVEPVSPYGRDSKYRWLRGRLQRVHVPGGEWKIRYLPLDVQDEWGGSVILAPDARLNRFRDGDYVYVEGEVLARRPTLYLAGPLYRVDLIRSVDIAGRDDGYRRH